MKVKVSRWEGVSMYIGSLDPFFSDRPATFPNVVLSNDGFFLQKGEVLAYVGEIKPLRTQRTEDGALPDGSKRFFGRARHFRRKLPSNGLNGT